MWAYFSSLARANVVVTRTNFSDSEQPVLLLYGFGATRRSLSILENRLRKDGFDVFSLRLGGFLDLFNTHSMEPLTQYVAQRIEEIYSRYPLPRMAIIGYSKGGLVGRYYLTNYGGEKRVHTLITLAAPHQGTPWSWFWFFSKGLRQMTPNSSFMKQLRETPLPKATYVASIYSEQDRVSPPRSSFLTAPSGNFVNVPLQQLRHSDFVIKRTAYDEILKYLKSGFARDAVASPPPKRP